MNCFLISLSIEVTAFVCENDVVAIQTMNLLRQHGYHIPEDFSIIGFDDIQAAVLLTRH